MNENQCVVAGLGMLSVIVRAVEDGGIRFLSCDSDKANIIWTPQFAGAYIVNGFDRAEDHAVSLGLQPILASSCTRQKFEMVARKLRRVRLEVQEMLNQAQSSESLNPQRILEL